MKEILLIIYLACIVMSAMTALFFRKGLKTHGLIIMLPFLFFVSTQEVTLYTLDKLGVQAPTDLIYNIYRPVAVLFFSFLFYNVPLKKSIKRVIILIAALYISFAVMLFSKFESISKFSNNLGTATGLTLTLYGMLFLFFFLNLDTEKEEDKWRPLYVVTIGLVVFYPIVNIVNLFHLQDYKVQVSDMQIYQLVPRVMSIFMYCTFTRAFFLCRTKN